MKYKVGIWEETSGYIDVEAKSQGEAKDVAVELLGKHGIDVILHPPQGDEELIKYNGDHAHQEAVVLSCEEITE